MLAYARLGWPLQASLTRRDGYEPEEIYSALSWAARLQQPALSAVTLPSLLAKKKIEAGSVASRAVKEPELATADPSENTEGAAIADAKGNAGASCVYVVGLCGDRDPLQRRRPWAETRVRNAGAGGGETGQCAGCWVQYRGVLEAGRRRGGAVVSIDTDVQAVDRLCESLAGSGREILPLCVDLAHPTPATGWENREYASFLSRCAGHFDTVMMLAVLHHLMLRNQIPLDRIAMLCSGLTTRHLILEWVPPADPKFQELLRGRGAIYGHITEAAFREAFGVFFGTVDEMTLANGRIMLHLEKR